MMFELLLFWIMSYTLSSIIVQQKIFEEPRQWLKQCSTGNPRWFWRKICQLVSCMFCTGFWSGVFISSILGFGIVLEVSLLPYIFLHGLLGAFGSYLIHLLVGLLIKQAEEKGIDT